MSPARTRHAANRLKEAPVEVWARAYALICADPFCRGTNDRGWRASFDYALRPEKSGRWLDAARSPDGPRATQDRAALSVAEILAYGQEGR